jgi:hypothetical protein
MRPNTMFKAKIKGATVDVLAVLAPPGEVASFSRGSISAEFKGLFVRNPVGVCRTLDRGIVAGFEEGPWDVKFWTVSGQVFHAGHIRAIYDRIASGVFRDHRHEWCRPEFRDFKSERVIDRILITLKKSGLVKYNKHFAQWEALSGVNPPAWFPAWPGEFPEGQA